jgi:hypothetical protein
MGWRTLLDSLVRKVVTPRPHHASRWVYPQNAPGDFYVENGCCTLCGVPWSEAPELFAVDDKQCYVKRQPTNDAEVHKMISVMEIQELACIRYKGRDQAIVEAIRADAGDWLIDN